MSKRVVVVGDSLMSVLVTRALDRKIGALTHVSLTHLSQSPSLVYPHQATIFGHLEAMPKDQLFAHAQLKVGAVKSVNLNDRTVTTEGGVEEYDFLVLDQQPAYSEEFWRELRSQLSTLYASLEAGANLGQEKNAQITVDGFSLSTTQLALAIRRDCLSHKQPKILVKNFNTDPVVGPFLTSSMVRSRERLDERNLPGLVIKEPVPIVTADNIKGAKVAHDGTLVVGGDWTIEGGSALIVPRSLAWQVNMVSASSLLARQIAAVVLPKIEDRQVKKPELFELESAIFLQGVKESLLVLKNMRSHRFRAQLAMSTERFFWERLQNLNW